MWERCTNPANRHYKHYGARGIWVCERWRSFEHFIEDVGPRPFRGAQLDRVDNDGPYHPDNFRWTTGLENMRNSTAVRIIEYNGEARTVIEWAEQLGMKARVLYTRLSKGWSVERALTQPVRKSPTKKTAIDHANAKKRYAILSSAPTDQQDGSTGVKRAGRPVAGGTGASPTRVINPPLRRRAANR